MPTEGAMMEMTGDPEGNVSDENETIIERIQGGIFGDGDDDPDKLHRRDKD